MLEPKFEKFIAKECKCMYNFALKFIPKTALTHNKNCPAYDVRSTKQMVKSKKVSLQK